MPRYKKPGTGRDFQKGNPGGPGRKKIPEELKEAKKLDHALFRELVTNMTRMSKEELEAHIKDPKTSMLEIMIYGQMKAAILGKNAPMGLLLDRTAGPVIQQIKMDLKGTMSERLSIMTEEQKQQRLEDLKKALDES